MKTLVIDDDLALESALSSILENNGVYDHASDGIIGLNMVLDAYESGHPYNLVILDVVLPELDGHNIIRKIREWELLHNIDPLDEVRILVVSRRRDEPTILKAIRNGASGWISKPIEVRQFLHKINELCSAEIS